MCHFTPDCYKDFPCIAGRCRHSCCIGWEIDVDPDKLCSYNAVPGPFGDRLRANISPADPPHFILGEGERCPFLNSENLCDIILTLSEDQINKRGEMVALWFSLYVLILFVSCYLYYIFSRIPF